MNNRIFHLDVLRGLAILGILLMNLPEFGMTDWRAENAALWDGVGSFNYKVWQFVYVFFEGKMRGILSVMFGVSIILFTMKREGDSELSTADAYFRRMWWLLIICFFTSYILLSMTTILWEYAICGIFLYVFRNLRAKWLISAGVVLLLIYSLKAGSRFFDSKEKYMAYAEAVEKKKSGVKLDSLQVGAIEAWNNRQKENIEQLKEASEWTITEIKTAHAGYGAIFMRMGAMLTEGFFVIDLLSMFETMGTILLGMGLFKTRFLRAEWKASAYLMSAVTLIIVGTIVGYYRSYVNTIADNDITGSALSWRWISTNHYEQVHRFCFVFGYISLFIFFCRTRIFKKMLHSLECVGRMAISNYVFQNFLCTIIFFGYGFDLYNSLQRYQLFFLVGAIWIIQISFSLLWLRYFRIGPLEWCWRSLIYLKKQPFKISTRQA